MPRKFVVHKHLTPSLLCHGIVDYLLVEILPNHMPQLAFFCQQPTVDSYPPGGFLSHRLIRCSTKMNTITTKEFIKF